MAHNILSASEDARPAQSLAHGRVASALRRRSAHLLAQIRGLARAVRLAVSGNRIEEPLE